MAPMIKWFSIRRIVLWIALSSSVMVSLIWMGKQLSRPRPRSITAFRKAQAKIEPGVAPPAHGVIVNNTASATSDRPPGFEDAILVPRPLGAAFTPKEELAPEAKRPFEMKNEAIKSAYNDFLNSTKQSQISMEQYLWDRFRVEALSESEKIPAKSFERFRRSILRHVSMFYGEYLLLGGREPRHFGVLACGEIGLGGGTGEYVNDDLDNLAGSQGSLLFREIAYHKSLANSKNTSFPFMLTQEGNAQMVVKYYELEKHQHEDGHQKKTEQGHESVSEKAIAAETRVFSRELNGLSIAKGIAGAVQAVCYERHPEMRIIYPFLRAGDLVPLADDHLAYYDPADPKKQLLTPDTSFLPRFFRQLVETVYEIHQKGLLHLDLKPENFVVYGPDRKFVLPASHPALERYRLVLVDFGLARRLEDIRPGQCIDRGTDVIMAPEQVMCNNGTGRGTDWWEVGAAMWRTRVFWEPTLQDKEREEILHAKHPQWGHYVHEHQSFFSEEFWDLLCMLLKPRPDDRDYSKDERSIRKLLDHPYLLKGLPNTQVQH